jgi:hypothetical protein
MLRQQRQSLSIQVSLRARHNWSLKQLLTCPPSNSMSHEFYQILVGSPTISIYSWKQLALWSLEYSCLTPAQITEAKAYFEVAWKEFCQCIVDKYGHLVKDGEINTEAAEKMYGPPILPPEA